MVYDYLFYKSYQFARGNDSPGDSPVWSGILWLGAVVMFNMFALSFLLEAWGWLDAFPFKKQYKYIFSISIVVVLFAHYSYKSRYKKIIESYEAKERARGKGIHPLVIILLYTIGSFLLAMLAAMYKNGTGVFK